MSSTLQILGAYSLIIIILGTFGNILTIYVCSKSKNNPTFVLLQYLAANNLISLFYWNLSHFTETIHFDITSYSMFGCKVGAWTQFSSLQTSAWILVFMI